MKKASYSIGKITIPTYTEPDREELPMFSENRVHQRTSGRPYPNKVVMQVDRVGKTDVEYKLVTLENDYVRIEILPEIGGRIYSAYDKSTGYDYFYKQHVIKPALIGVLGSWISGGVEFNWPFHHRASGFLPCDFTVEECSDGSVACHLSEHDPIDRMKGMVSVILRPDSTALETRMRLYNRTAERHSFLWWENAAVPVNESYRIFFPQDVSYVNFHYLKSRTTYPIAGNGVYNGIPMKDARDISWHKNTKQATSYFAAASDYDFFGGYDCSRGCGVVHIGDHHISPGKKMFTWAYCQLAKSWENALTDTDGQYAELMAGSYSDNQPDFAWLAPYETKQFSQYWYPISGIGVPTFANLNAALRIDREAQTVSVQTTREYNNLLIKIFDGERVYVQHSSRVTPADVLTLNVKELPSNVSVSISDEGKSVAEYTERKYDRLNMPPTITDMPQAKSIQSADELYLAGVHVEQYRDPHTNPDSFWKAAIERNIHHIPSLIAMARYELARYDMDSALSYAHRAIDALTVYNNHPESGEAYYIMGRVLECMGDTDNAYNSYYRAYWAHDCVAKAMTRLAVLDMRRGDFNSAAKHAKNALDYGRSNNLARLVLVLALKDCGEVMCAEKIAKESLASDPLDHAMRFASDVSNLYEKMDSDAVQTCIDIAFDLADMGRYKDIVALLSGLEKQRPDMRIKPLYYALGYYRRLIGEPSNDYTLAATATLGNCYPSRFGEIAILTDAAACGDSYANMLLGCLYYNKLQYEKACRLWESSKKCSYIARRNIAVAYFSHLNRHEEALVIMKELTKERRSDQELLYETVTLMDKMCISPKDKISLIKRAPAVTRDDVLTELAKAYNQAGEHESALSTLMSHDFVPCEGGEHAIADQYLFAKLAIGRRLLEQGKLQEALDTFREGQILPQSLGAGTASLYQLNTTRLSPLSVWARLTRHIRYSHTFPR